MNLSNYSIEELNKELERRKKIEELKNDAVGKYYKLFGGKILHIVSNEDGVLYGQYLNIDRFGMDITSSMSIQDEVFDKIIERLNIEEVKAQIKFKLNEFIDFG